MNILFDVDGLVQIGVFELFHESVCIASNDGKNLQQMKCV